MKREKIYIIKSKNANKHIVPDYAVLENEYKKYKARTLSTVEEDYLNSIKILEKKTDKKQ